MFVLAKDPTAVSKMPRQTSRQTSEGIQKMSGINKNVIRRPSSSESREQFVLPHRCRSCCHCLPGPDVYFSPFWDWSWHLFDLVTPASFWCLLYLPPAPASQWTCEKKDMVCSTEAGTRHSKKENKNWKLTIICTFIQARCGRHPWESEDHGIYALDTHMCMCVCACMCVPVCTWACMHACVCVCTCVCVCVHVCVYVCMCIICSVCVCMCMYAMNMYVCC